MLGREQLKAQKIEPGKSLDRRPLNQIGLADRISIPFVGVQIEHDIEFGGNRFTSLAVATHKTLPLCSVVTLSGRTLTSF